jgi:hypothetical protein
MFSGALMTLSLLAVPCVAVFGLPSVGQAVTDADAKDGIALGETDDLGTPAASPAVTAEAPGFAPMVDAESSGATAASASLGDKVAMAEPHLDPTSDRRGAAANMAVGLEESPRAQPAGETPEAFPSGNVFKSVDDTELTKTETPAQVATWENVVERLGGFGVRDFHLTNGEVPGQFYFTCSIRDARRNLTRRFEAEGTSAVLAAEDVLAQVEECLGTR